ncbi:MAG: hypothetical protein N3F11_06525 [Casimicrobiaceae bacterium]|nr:hypothetical protein [Casimicrobiaceae bacterium]
MRMLYQRWATASFACLLAVFAHMLSGCATVTTGTTQSVLVTTARDDGREVEGATCTIRNSKGAWSVVTPGSIHINKANADAHVECRKQGLPSGTAIVQSTTRAHTAGNIVLGGVIGLGVDAMSGAMWAYPDVWRIVLGRQGQLIK